MFLAKVMKSGGSRILKHTQTLQCTVFRTVIPEPIE